MTRAAENVGPIRTDILVIGAGQAALALGHHLRSAPHTYRLVDGVSRIGDSWRNRYDSLVLFTPRAFSALPGLPLAGDPDGYPTKDEMADYLERYAQHFALPIALGTDVRTLRRTNGVFEATTTDGRLFESRVAVLANGAFQTPAVPTLARDLSADVVQHTATSYRRPSQIPPGTVVVVGDGATGRQIALELAPGRRVFLATGRPRRVSPERLLGKSLFWWLDSLGVLSASRHSAIGRFLMKADPFPGKHLEAAALGKQGVTFLPRLVSASGRTVRFQDGRTFEADAVIWTTGYREETAWVDIPGAKDGGGQFVHDRGVTTVDGLYLLGRSWQWTRGSAILHGVARDAQFIASHFRGLLDRSRRAT